MTYEANQALQQALGAEDLAAELLADANHLLRQHGANDPKIVNRLIYMLTDALLHAQIHRQEVEEHIGDLYRKKPA